MSVTEPLPFTSVPKFITIYLLSRQFLHVVVVYSSCCSPATYRIEFNDNFFKNNHRKRNSNSWCLFIVVR